MPKPDRFWKAFWTAMVWYAVWMTLAVVLLSSCATTRLVPVPVVFDPTLETYGLTKCTDDNEIIVFVLEGQTAMPMDVIIRHEMIHANQILDIGDCEGFMALYKASASFRFYTETEAYCESIPKEKLQTEWPMLLEFLHRVYGQHAKWTEAMSEVKFKKLCKKVDYG